MNREQEVDEFLEHYGVKGMRWGKRKASSGPSGPSRKTSRAEGKAIKKAASENRNREIDKARDKIEKGYENFAKVKKEYKGNKKTMGKAAAKQIVNSERSKLQITEIKNTDLAFQLKSGRETTDAILFTVGATLAAAVIGGVSAYNS